MNISYFINKSTFHTTFLNRWLLIFLLILPVSCSAQKNTLTSISSIERGDKKGHVIRFHLNKASRTFKLSQPEEYRIQFELYGNEIDTTNIGINDRSNILKQVDFYTISGGIGVDLFLKKGAFFYQANAYPDRDSKDMLLALTKTTRAKLSQHVKTMKAFAWANGPPSEQKDDKETEDSLVVDTGYQKIKDKIKFDTVVLDAGHGGTDVGAIGYHRTYEKNVILAITKKVGEYINKYLPDVKVVYTRDGDYLVGSRKNSNISIMESLVERGQIANRAEGDLFVSIHCNSAGSSQAHGTETYFLGLERSKTALDVMKRENNIVGENTADLDRKLSQEDLIIYELANSGYIASSEKLAGMVQNQFKNRAGRRTRGVKQARFVVLYHASMPAILIETGFITNPSEQKFLTSDYGQSIIASAIFRAIRDYKVQFDKSQHFNTK